MADTDIIMFDGISGKGAKLDLDLPLPNSYSGKRIVEIATEDIEWRQRTLKIGDDWEDKTYDNQYRAVDPELMGGLLFDQLHSHLPHYTANVMADVGASKADFNRALTRVKARALDALSSISSDQIASRAWRSKLDIRRTSIAADSTGIPLSSSDQLEDKLADYITDALKVACSSPIDHEVLFPAETWMGDLKWIKVRLDEKVKPVLFIIQEIGISNFPSAFGLGKVVKAMSLFPGEETTISTRTWKSSKSTSSESMSILESTEGTSTSRFEESVTNEMESSYSETETSNWEVEAEVSGSIGPVGGSGSASASGESSATLEGFSNSLESAVSEHATTSSNSRENSVTSSTELTEESGFESNTERVIKNINLKRVLNFLLRELTCEYSTKIHLKGIRIGFANGRLNSWQEVGLEQLMPFLESLIKPDDIPAVFELIMQEIGVVLDSDVDGQYVVEQVKLTDCGRVATSDLLTPLKLPDGECSWYDGAYAYEGDDSNTPEADPPLVAGTWKDFSHYYRFSKGDPDSKNSIGQDGDDNPVPGVLLREKTIVMRTDSIIADALLSPNNALDEYSQELQEETIREKKLANNQAELAINIVESGDTAKAAIYSDLFGSDESES